jgi:ubiquinone/menaquinone biosynthesis C-methylase UbiE
MSSSTPDLEAVQIGFSAMAAEYDAMADTHPVVIWMRDRIRGMVEAQLSPGDSVLEINAGSGLDALYFASRGYRVHATDVAPGMLEALAEKAQRPEAGGRLTFEAVSNSELDTVAGGPYDLVFSNLGGLNCTDDLGAVTRHLLGLLTPEGKTVLVVMPPLCPWELLQAFRGHIGTARRRLSREGTLANVGGAQVRTWYHAPHKLERALGPAFETVALRSFCTFSPPSYFDGFVRRHSGITQTLMRLDDRLAAMPGLRSIGDFYALASRKASTVG